MADENIDAALASCIQDTQRLLGPFVVKPKLADKYLAKPPFKFLFDVFKGCIESTGFPKGVFPEELQTAAEVFFFSLLRQHNFLPNL